MQGTWRALGREPAGPVLSGRPGSRHWGEGVEDGADPGGSSAGAESSVVEGGLRGPGGPGGSPGTSCPSDQRSRCRANSSSDRMPKSAGQVWGAGGVGVHCGEGLRESWWAGLPHLS